MAYTYRGKTTIAAEEAARTLEAEIRRRAEAPTAKGAERKRRAQAVCGTPSGYQKHLRLGAEPCRRCKDANAEYARERRGTTRTYHVEQGCGTHAGYQRHRRNNEYPCQPCAEARLQYQREYRRRKVA